MSSSIAIVFIGVAVLFILGIKFLSSPKTARYGNLLAAFGMLVALFATIPLLNSGNEASAQQGWNLNYTLMVVGIVIGLVIGAIGAYSVKMTAMPQMVAAFNGLGRRVRGAGREPGISAARATATKASQLFLR